MKATLIQELRSLPGAFRVLFLGTFINRFGTFVFPFLTLMLTKRGVSLSWVGVVLSGYGVGMFAATFVGGWSADRFGRKRTIVSGTMAQAASVLALYYASDPAVLVLLTAASGFAGGFYNPASSALVADLVPHEGRLTAFALLRLAGNGGFACGTAVGGLLVSRSHFWLFAGDAITTATFGVLAWWLLPSGGGRPAVQARWRDAALAISRDAAFWMLAFAQAGAAFIFAQYASAYALEIGRRGTALGILGWSLGPEQVYAGLIGWNGVLVMCLELAATRFTRAFRPSGPMAVGYLLVGIGFAMNAFEGGLGLLALGMTIFTFGEMLIMPMVGVWISRIAPAEMRGRYMGALAGAWALGSISGQNVGLALFGRNPSALWWVCAFAGLGSAAVISMAGRPAKKPQPVVVRLYS